MKLFVTFMARNQNLKRFSLKDLTLKNLSEHRILQELVILIQFSSLFLFSPLPQSSLRHYCSEQVTDLSKSSLTFH